MTAECQRPRDYLGDDLARRQASSVEWSKRRVTLQLPLCDTIRVFLVSIDP